MRSQGSPAARLAVPGATVVRLPVSLQAFAADRSATVISGVLSVALAGVLSVDSQRHAGVRVDRAEPVGAVSA